MIWLWYVVGGNSFDNELLIYSSSFIKAQCRTLILHLYLTHARKSCSIFDHFLSGGWLAVSLQLQDFWFSSNSITQLLIPLTISCDSFRWSSFVRYGIHLLWSTKILGLRRWAETIYLFLFMFVWLAYDIHFYLCFYWLRNENDLQLEESKLLYFILSLIIHSLLLLKLQTSMALFSSP